MNSIPFFTNCTFLSFCVLEGRLVETLKASPQDHLVRPVLVRFEPLVLRPRFYCCSA